MQKITRYVAAAAMLLATGVVAYFASGHRELAPAVPYTVLDGSKRSIGELRSKVVLVNFWATTCVICVKEMPQMVETYDKYKGRGLDFVAVAMSHDPPASVVNYTERKKLPFQVAIDNTGAVARSFGDVAFTPTTFVINKRGEIVQRLVGEPDFAALHALLEQLLAEA